ncbi:MAG: hypothetical protein HZB38_16500, partial [Planctomycetes bacterium]|nr:hypothetical protein [Planctomycetota bacterium]
PSISFTVSASQPCVGDINNDHQVDLSDLTLLLSQFGSTGSSLPADLDNNGAVELADLTLLLSRFGLPCP